MNPRKTWARIEAGNLDLRFDDLLRLAYAFGYDLARQHGSHHVLVHAELPLMLNLQPADGKAKRYQVRQLMTAVRKTVGAESMKSFERSARYHIHVFWRDEDQCWVTDAPDLQYCSAHGETPAEAVAELEIAKSAWLETALERGLPIPEACYRPPLAG